MPKSFWQIQSVAEEMSFVDSYILMNGHQNSLDEVLKKGHLSMKFAQTSVSQQFRPTISSLAYTERKLQSSRFKVQNGKNNQRKLHCFDEPLLESGVVAKNLAKMAKREKTQKAIRQLQKELEIIEQLQLTPQCNSKCSPQ